MTTATLRKACAIALVLWTITVTALRTWRLPNDFSEAFWLLDYRWGFVKRGLVGTIAYLVGRLLDTTPSDGAIAVASIVLFVVFCVAISAVAVRIVQRCGWSANSLLVTLVFLSSPFMVMSAHLIGYFDNIIWTLTTVSMALLVTGRSWAAALVAAIAIAVHENMITVGMPVIALTWLALKLRHPAGRDLPLTPWLVPLTIFLLLSVGQGLVVNKHFKPRYEEYLNLHTYVKGNIPRMVPQWMSIGMVETFRMQGAIAPRYLDFYNQYLVEPTLLTMVAFFAGAFAVTGLLETLALVVVCAAPQLLHLMAWDTARIWTYSLATMFLAIWSCAETMGARVQSKIIGVFALLVILQNAALLTPLMEGETDHFTFGTRMLIFAPVVMVGAVLLLIDAPAAPAATQMADTIVRQTVSVA